jgi:hypothetical protein
MPFATDRSSARQIILTLKSSNFMKNWKITFIILGLIPYGFIISLLTFYFHAGIFLGRLPSYNQPDPKELSFYSSYYPFIQTTLEISLLTIFIWTAVSITYLILNRKSVVWRPVIHSSVGQAIAIVLFYSEIMNWYLD